jgi:hypothetical protein
VVLLAGGLVGGAGAAQANVPHNAAVDGLPFQHIVYETATPFIVNAGTSDFAMADWDNDGVADLVAVKKSRTGSGHTEVHITSGLSNFQEFIFQIGTALPQTDDSFAYAFADWDLDGRLDLFAISKSHTGTGITEVHILSGGSNFQEFIGHFGTGLHETDNTFEFAVADWDRDGRPDLLIVSKAHTGSGHTEVHILSGASDFQEFIDQTGTAMPETAATAEFEVGDWDLDGQPDLLAIGRAHTGSGHTEVRILSGASNFQQFLVQTGTALPETDANSEFTFGDWDFDGRLDLFAITTSPADVPPAAVRVLI